MAHIGKFTKCNLRILMKDKKIIFKTLGEYLGVSTQQAQKYGSGENEMSVRGLLQACQLLDCNPSDIYPEIKIYDKNFSIRKTLKKTQHKESDSTNTTIIHNNYYNVPNNCLNSTNSFFSNIRLLDINNKASLLIKIAIYFLCIFLLIFYIWRALGYSAGDHLSQLLFTSTVIIVVMGLVIPLILSSWITYILTFAAFRNIINVSYDYITVKMLHNNNQVASPAEWWIVAISALVLTFYYAFIIKRYLRNQKITKD